MTPSPINDLILTIKSRRRKKERKKEERPAERQPAGTGWEGGFGFIGRDPEELDWTVTGGGGGSCTPKLGCEKHSAGHSAAGIKGGRDWLKTRRRANVHSV